MEVVKRYTDENYIAINDLQSFGDDFVLQTQKYRKTFIEMIALNDLDFVKIVETPSLVKKRYEKNVELKGHVNVTSEHNDFILEIAKDLVLGKKIKGIDADTQKNIIKKYSDNNNDLTIVTNYLANNSNKLLSDTGNENISLLFPELSNKDIKFITESNNIDLYYSISDFQKTTKCSYETARKSLDGLAELKLFQKKKVGKKFVYKPTIKLNEIMKGVKNGY